jgi:hypothetical protein
MPPVAISYQRLLLEAEKAQRQNLLAMDEISKAVQALVNSGAANTDPRLTFARAAFAALVKSMNTTDQCCQFLETLTDPNTNTKGDIA